MTSYPPNKEYDFLHPKSHAKHARMNASWWRPKLFLQKKRGLICTFVQVLWSHKSSLLKIKKEGGMQKDQILNIANSKSLVRLFIFSKVKNSFHYKIIDMYIYWGKWFYMEFKWNIYRNLRIYGYLQKYRIL